MSTGAIAERYAQALFELGEEAGELDRLTEKLGEFAQLFQGSRELRAVLTHPRIPRAEKDNLLRALAQKQGLSALAVKCVLLINQRGRLSSLKDIVTRLTDLSDKKSGVVRASVTTATKLPESFFQNLTEQLAVATKKKIILQRSVDPALLGGAIAQVGDSVLDASVRGRLLKMERDLLGAVSAGST